MTSFLSKLRTYKMSILSGVLVGTSYIPFPPWAVLFCLAPLWINALRENKGWKSVFWKAWVTQFVLTLIGFHWIAFTAYEFGHMPWALAALSLLTFAALMHLYYPLSLVLTFFLKNRFHLSLPQSLFVAALLQGLLERLWPNIFPWNLGYSFLYSGLPIFHLGEFIGFEGLSMVVLILNALSGIFWLRVQSHKPWKGPILALFSAFLLLNILGLWRMRTLKHADENTVFHVVQANIGNFEKIAAESGWGSILNQVFVKHTQLTQKWFSKNPPSPQDLLVWPESAIPTKLDPAYHMHEIPSRLIQATQEWKVPLITGGLSQYAPEPGLPSKTYNSFFVFDPFHPQDALTYRKTHLLAFGETLPFGDNLPWLRRLLPFVADFGKGPGPQAINLKLGDRVLTLGPQICYEGLFPAFSRGLAKQGAQVLVNLTNDSWFTPPWFVFEPWQHFYMTAGRSIETRLPLIRATNTGISGYFDQFGNLHGPSDLLKEWAGSYPVKYESHPEMTFYVKYGYLDWVIWTMLLFILLGSAYFLKGSPRREYSE